MIVAVATPRSWNSTAFWLAIDDVVKMAPEATPISTIGRTSVQYAVEPSIWAMASRPRMPTKLPTIG